MDETAEPTLVARALDYIGALYTEESAIADEKLNGAKKLARRAEHCKPIVEQFFEWCERQLQDEALLPTNPFTQALAYTRQRRAELVGR